MIPPEEFRKIPDEGVADDIERKHLPIELLLPQDKKQEEKVEEIQKGFIDLDRMAQ